MSLYIQGGKRGFDFLCALVSLVVLSPLMAVTALILLVADGRPVLFAQDRAGRNGKTITVLKFRTMAVTRTNASKAKRVTRFGRLLRQTSLDELPQLINVVRGDMSLVGPRPLHLRYIPRYSDTHRLRMTVRPGLTGLAQVSGRNNLSWDEKFDFDVAYVKSMSLREDISICLRTLSLLAYPHRGTESTEPSSEYFGNHDEGNP